MSNDSGLPGASTAASGIPVGWRAELLVAASMLPLLLALLVGHRWPGVVPWGVSLVAGLVYIAVLARLFRRRFIEPVRRLSEAAVRGAAQVRAGECCGRFVPRTEGAGRALRELASGLDGVLDELASARRRLEDGAAGYRALFSEMHQGLALLEAVETPSAETDFVLAAVNPAFEALFEAAGGTLAGRRLREALPRLGCAVFAQLTDVVRSGCAMRFEIPVGDSDRRFEARVFRLSAARIALMLDDVSERSRCDAALRQEQQFFRLLIENLPGIFYLYSYPGLRLELWNRQHEDLLGYAAEDLKGRHLAEWFAPEVRAQVLAAVDEAMASGQSLLEERLLARDGRRIPFALSGIRFEQGGRRYLIGIGLDLSERLRAEQELAEYRHHLADLVVRRTAELAAAKESAESASLAKSRFLATVSHEIRTPMHAVLGLANLLRRAGLTPLQSEYLNKIDTAAAHLLEVVNDVLDLSRAEAGKFVLEEVPVDIATLLENVCTIVSERARAKGLALRVETEGLPAGLYGDPGRLQQAMLNYAANAVKFTERGSVTLRARLQEEAATWGVIRFEVEDTGVGVEPAVLPRLFQAYEQGSPATARTHGGSGLGLSINRKLAELMGGDVGVESTPGLGSLFWLTARLRKRANAGDDATIAAVADAERLLREVHGGRRVLLVDDDPANLEIARFLLEDAGLLVDAVADGEQAVRRAGASAYALILMDIRLPGLDGLGATRMIRELPGHRDTPILALTANAFAEDRGRCLAAGMNDFIAKPFDFDVFFATILRWLA